MNSTVLEATVLLAPQMRYTADSQTPVAEFRIEFPGLKDDDPPAELTVETWGKLAERASAEIQEGQAILIQGRLSMNTIDRPEGFKEKTARLTANDWSLLGGAVRPSAPRAAAPAARPAPPPPPSEPSASYDDIPF